MYEELKKLCSRKNLLFIICMLAANFLILIISAENGMYGNRYTPRSYRETFDIMSGMTSLEKESYLQEQVQMSDGEMTLADYENQRMYQELLQDAGKIAHYETYIQGLEEDIRQKYEISIFADKSTFEEKRDEKLLASYEKLHGTEVVYDPSEGLSMIDFAGSGLILVGLILFLAISSILKEQEDGILPVLRCTKNGRGKFFARKSLAVWILGGCLCALFLVENLAVGGALYGLGDLMRPLQSLKGYEASGLRIFVWQFLLFVWLVRTVVVWLIAQFALFCAILLKRTTAAFGVCLAAGAVSMAGYYGIAPDATLGILHYINPAAMVKAAPLFQEEAYLNLLGNPVSPVAGVTAAVIFAAGILIFGICFFSRTEKSRRRRIRNKEKRVTRAYSGSVCGQELYKLFVLQKGAVLLGLFVILQLVFYPADYRASSAEIRENIYIRQLEGTMGEYQQQWIEEEQMRMTQDSSISGDERQVFEGRILPLYESLQEKQSAGEEARFIIQSGYEKLFGISNQSRDVMAVLFYAMMLVFGCSMYLSMERLGGMVQLIEPTKKGWRTVKRAKQRIALLYTVGCALIAWGFEFVWIIGKYGLKHLDAPLNWLLEFRDWEGNIRIWMYLGGLLLLRVAGGILTCLCILKISELCKSNVTAMGISLFLFVVPAVLAMLEVPLMKAYTLNAFLDGNVILQSGNWKWAYLAAALVLLFLTVKKKAKEK